MTEDRSPDALLTALARRIAAADRVSPPPADDALQAIAEAAVSVLGSRAVSIATHDPAADRLVFVAAAGPAAGDVVGLAINAAAGIAGYAFTTGQPLAVADAASDPRFDRTVSEATGYTPRSLLATPLLDPDGAVGVLEALDARDGTFTLRDLEVAGVLATAAAHAVRARRIERDGARLVRRVLADALTTEGPEASPTDDLDPGPLVERALADLGLDGEDDPTWRLADRIARLRAVDPALTDLAIDWLDALLARRRPTR